MKALVVALMLSGLSAFGATDNPEKKKAPAASSAGASVEQQLARQLTYPAVLRNNLENSVVVVQFRLDERNRVVRPQVFSANEQLNDELVQQLIKAKLRPAEPIAYVEQVYTARLRFTKE